MQNNTSLPSVTEVQAMQKQYKESTVVAKQANIIAKHGGQMSKDTELVN